MRVLVWFYSETFSVQTWEIADIIFGRSVPGIVSGLTHSRSMQFILLNLVPDCFYGLGFGRSLSPCIRLLVFTGHDITTLRGGGGFCAVGIVCISLSYGNCFTFFVIIALLFLAFPSYWSYSSACV